MPERLKKLLRWSEKYTKTDMVYLFEGSFWSTVAQFGTAVLSFALAIIVSRFVSKDAYGIYKYVLSAVAVLSTFSLTGLSTAVFQSVARGYEGALQEGFRQNLRWSALVFLGSLGLAIYYFILHNYTLALGVLIGGCSTPFLSSANLASSYLAGKKDFRRQALFFGLWGSGIPIACLIGAALINGNPLWLIAIYTIANVASSLYFYKCTLALYHPDPTKKDSGMMGYGKHLSLIGVLGGIAGNLDQILVFHYVGAADLAIYNFATAILDQTGGPLKTVSNMITARYASHSDETINRTIWNKVFWFFILALVIVGVYIPLAPFLYHYLFPAYVAAVPYSQIYALSIFTIIFNPFAPYFIAKRKVKAQYYNNILNYILQIVVMAGGVMYWGLWGLIWARVFLRTVGTIPTALFYFANLGKNTEK